MFLRAWQNNFATNYSNASTFSSEQSFENLTEVHMPHDWESAYRAAILETEPTKLIGRIDSARTAICASLLGLDASGRARN